MRTPGVCVHGVPLREDCLRCNPDLRLPATKVVNLKTFLGDPHKTDGLVYVGRAFSGRGRGKSFRASPWANPFKPNYGDDKDRAAGECVLMYTRALLQRIDAKPDYLPYLRKQLRGKYLACWCVPYDWQCGMEITGWCHGIPLCMLAEGQEPREVIDRLCRRLSGSDHDQSAEGGVAAVDAGDRAGRPPQVPPR